jgi:signal transduction histidine kinase
MVSTRPAEAGFKFRVEGTGRGIEPDEFPYVFERFYRCDGSRDHATGGASLGLTIMKQIVSARLAGLDRKPTRKIHTCHINFSLSFLAIAEQLYYLASSFYFQIQKGL